MVWGPYCPPVTEVYKDMFLQDELTRLEQSRKEFNRNLETFKSQHPSNACTCIVLLRYKLLLHRAIRITWTEETCEQLPSPAVAVTRKGDNAEQMLYQYDSFELNECQMTFN